MPTAPPNIAHRINSPQFSTNYQPAAAVSCHSCNSRLFNAWESMNKGIDQSITWMVTLNRLSF